MRLTVDSLFPFSKAKFQKKIDCLLREVPLRCRGWDSNPLRAEKSPADPFFYVACEETITGAIKQTDNAEEDLRVIIQTIIGVKVSEEMNNPLCWK